MLGGGTKTIILIGPWLKITLTWGRYFQEQEEDPDVFMGF